MHAHSAPPAELKLEPCSDDTLINGMVTGVAVPSSRRGAALTEVRAAVAFNPSTAPETLQRLASDISAVVRSCVGQNPSTPPAVLAVLAVDSDSAVRYPALANPAAEQAVFDAAAAASTTGTAAALPAAFVAPVPGVLPVPL